MTHCLRLGALATVLFVLTFHTAAQEHNRADRPREQSAQPAAPSADAQAAQVKVPPDQSITADDSVTINGVSVPYRVTTGTQPVWDAGA